MYNRYRDRNGILGKHFSQISRFILSIFPEMPALKTFVRTNLGQSTEHSICWEQGLAYVSHGLISHCQSQGRVGQLLEALQQTQPENEALGKLIEDLVEAGYLQDRQRAVQAVAAPPSVDWMRKYPYDSFALGTRGRDKLISEISTCFESAGSFEGFLLSNFGDFGRQIAHRMGGSSSLESNVSLAFGEFEHVRKLTAFVAAVHAADRDNLVVAGTFFFLTQPPPETPAPPVAARPQSAQSSQRHAPTVQSLLQPLPAAQKEELLGLLVKAFNLSDLTQLCDYKLDERLDTIAAPGPYPKMADAVVQWCAQHETKLVALLNAMLEARGRRSDIRGFVHRLALENYISLEI